MISGIQAFIMAKDKIQSVTVNCSHFIIGKAEKNILGNYKNGYNEIKPVYISSSNAKVDRMESLLIGYFLSVGKLNKNRLYHPKHNKFQPKCDNKVFCNRKMGDSNLYCVYVAVKD